MARSSSSRPNDHDCLRLLATSSPRTRGAEKKESTGLRLSQPCPQYVTPSSISSGGRRLSGVRTAENKSLKSRRTNRFCQSSAKPCSRGSIRDLIRASYSFAMQRQSEMVIGGAVRRRRLLFLQIGLCVPSGCLTGAMLYWLHHPIL